MKILLYTYYFFRSVFLRGFFNTLSIIRYEKVGEKKYGIKTTGIKISKSATNHHYQGASYLILEQILPLVYNLLPTANFVDIGCGMGRVCFVAKAIGFKKIIGFDLNAALIKQAKKNINLENGITFEVANALEYDYKKTDCVYFLFNPFNDFLLKQVIKKIEQTKSEKTIIVYMNPIHKSCFDQSVFKELKRIETKRYLEAVIYSN